MRSDSVVVEGCVQGILVPAHSLNSSLPPPPCSTLPCARQSWPQIKVAALGKSGVSVGYFDTEDAAARAYDRAAIGLLGRQNCRAILNFPMEEYDHDSVPELVGA